MLRVIRDLASAPLWQWPILVALQGVIAVMCAMLWLMTKALGGSQ